ncbi:ATP-binding Cassette (ABC) Superfamily, partial [Thraustotheca clavata]
EACRRLGKPERVNYISIDHASGYTLAELLTRNNYVRVRDFCTWWLTEDRFEAFHNFLDNAMPQMNCTTQILERQNDVCRFKLVGSSLRLSTIFSILEGCKLKLHLEEYTVAQTTLEQIFNNFASQQTQEKGVARGMAVHGNYIAVK